VQAQQGIETSGDRLSWSRAWLQTQTKPLPNDICYYNYNAVNAILSRRRDSLIGSRAKSIPNNSGNEVAQTKKNEVRRAILDAAFQVFAEHGYTKANISHIAKLAKVSPANVYSYFPSKLNILFAIYDPWLTKQFDALERSVGRISDPSQRLEKILSTLWQDIPSANNGFANNMMQALSTATTREGYKPTLRYAVEKRLTKLLENCLPNLGHTRVHDLANILFMAFDGYILNFRLIEGATCPHKRVELLADILLYCEGGWPSKATARGPRTNRHPRSRQSALSRTHALATEPEA
jgi:AcrR family transcriptional regulator